MISQFKNKNMNVRKPFLNAKKIRVCRNHQSFFANKGLLNQNWD